MQPSVIASIAPRVEIGCDHDSGVAQALLEQDGRERCRRDLGEDVDRLLIELHVDGVVGHMRAIMRTGAGRVKLEMTRA
jgi:hypothetical protein